MGKEILINSKVKDIERNYNSMGNTLNGHESVLSPIKVLNYDNNSKKLYHAEVKRLIRHKVNKAKWKLKSGKYSIIITNDHSLIVFRNDKMIEVKPVNVQDNDNILIVNNENEYEFRKIDYCKKIGKFEDEYVYDIEVDDYTHTFIANDILVHNSIYVTFEEVLKKCDWKGEERDFIMKLYKLRIEQFFVTVLQKYADSYQAENFLSFDLESIAKTGIWLAKKKYLQDIVWTDPDIYYDTLSKIKVKGWETIQASTPIASKKILDNCLRIIFEDIENLKIDRIVEYLQQAKRQFKLEDIEDVCENKRMNNYDSYVVDDVTKIELRKGAGPNVKGTAFHNYLLNNSNLKNKYELLYSSGERFKLYYTDDKRCETFCFSSGKYPYEFAPEINYDTQFEKTVLDSLNRVLTVIGLQQLNINLMFTKSLF